MSAAETWFRRSPAFGRAGAAGLAGTVPGPVRTRLRLVCFPHAGGNSQLFRGWQARLPSDVEVLAVCYPGRRERMGEPCVESMDELADRITAALTPYRDLPLALFGHSMGAAVAYEVAGRLEAGSGEPPVRLLVSGRNAPHRIRPTALHRAADEVLVAGVSRLGTLGGDVYSIPALRELLLPVLRSDYRLIENYQPQQPVRLRTPITAYQGDRDPATARAGVLGWEELTGGGFDQRSFPGDHFYLAPQESELTADIAARLANVGSGLMV